MSEYQLIHRKRACFEHYTVDCRCHLHGSHLTDTCHVSSSSSSSNYRSSSSQGAFRMRERESVCSHLAVANSISAECKSTCGTGCPFAYACSCNCVNGETIPSRANS